MRSGIALMLALAQSQAAPVGTTHPTPAVWPETFTIDLSTNLSWAPESATLASALPGAIGATLYYDWAHGRVQRVDHGAGNIECVDFYHTHGPCSLVMRPDGLYRIIASPAPAQPACCLDLASITCPPPNWASASARYVGRRLLPYTRLRTLAWEYPQTVEPGGACSTRHNATDSGCHTYQETAPGEYDSPRPALFSFPAKGGNEDWYFDPSSMRLDPIDARRFDLPDGCAGVPCAAPVSARALSTLLDPTTVN